MKEFAIIVSIHLKAGKETVMSRIFFKPSHELFGEILLRAKRPKEAAEQFATSLRRHKNHARSLLGVARAAARRGDTKGAANFYAQFARQWQQADAQLPELREAPDYSKQASTRWAWAEAEPPNKALQSTPGDRRGFSQAWVPGAAELEALGGSSRKPNRRLRRTEEYDLP